MLYEKSGECIIIDPGCFDVHEEQELETFIRTKQLKPVMLVNTHCHIDHVLGNKFVFDTYGLKPIYHPLEVQVMDRLQDAGRMFGVTPTPSPEPLRFLEEGEEITFGGTTLKVLFTPGHSPGSVSLYCEKGKYVIAGDVLFQGSIGRTDLPGGNFDQLAESIRTQLYPLDPLVKVWPGHGPATTIGHEMRNNPFVKAL